MGADRGLGGRTPYFSDRKMVVAAPGAGLPVFQGWALLK